MKNLISSFFFSEKNLNFLNFIEILPLKEYKNEFINQRHFPRNLQRESDLQRRPKAET